MDALLEKDVHVEIVDGVVVEGAMRNRLLRGKNEIRPATKEEIQRSVEAHRGLDYDSGTLCDGLVWLDEPGFMYVERKCAICGRHLGLI